MKPNKFVLSMVPFVAAAAILQPAAGNVILNADYSTGQGYSTGNLQFQNGWLGQASAQVDTGTETVSSVGGPFDRNCHGAGALGGTGGVPQTALAFEQYAQITITFDYQFTLSADANIDLGKAGLRTEGPNAGNGFDATPEQGFKMAYNGFGASGGTVKFWPDLNDTANGDAMILDGVNVGIDPGGDLGPADLVSDPLQIVTTYAPDGAGNFDVTSLTVTNLTTTTTYTYGGPAQSFAWTATDAFFAQQLAPNPDASFTGTSGGVIFEYDPAPAVRPFATIDYTSAEGYAAGNLNGQNGWIGQNSPQVDLSGTGSVTSGTFARNSYGNGLTGGAGGVPNATGSFTAGEKIQVIFDYQFDLGGATNDVLGKVGFRNDPAGDAEWAAEQGFSMEFSQFNIATEGGNVKFWPSLVDEGLGNVNALIITGYELGIDPADSLGGGVDELSNRLRIFYELGIVGDGTWTVDKLVVANLDTGMSWCYDGPDRVIDWTDPDPPNDPYTDAFFSQQLTRSSKGATATTDRVEINVLAVVEDAPVIDVDYTFAECYTSGTIGGQGEWAGQNIAVVDASGTGTATSSGDGTFDRNYWGLGLLGGTGGVPNPGGSFAAGDQIDLTFYYQFELPSDVNAGLATAGFREDPDGSGQFTPEQGFKSEYNGFDSGPDTDGNVKFWPDRNDTANGDAMILEGLDVGIDPGATTPDLLSDPLRIDTTYVYDGAGNFDVMSFTVTNLTTGTTYTYSGPAQSFPWAGTDAFFAQQLAPNNKTGFKGITDGVAVSFTAGAAELEVTSIVKSGTDVTLEYVSSVGDVDVYASGSLEAGTWTKVGMSVAASPFVENGVTQALRFYVLTKAGDPNPYP